MVVMACRVGDGVINRIKCMVQVANLNPPKAKPNKTKRISNIEQGITNVEGARRKPR